MTHRRTTTALAALGALALAGATVPAQARTTKEPATLTEWQRATEIAIDRYMEVPLELSDGDLRIVRIGVDFDAAGDVIGSHVIRSSGLAAADKLAGNIAHRVDYPRLPAAMRGKPQTIAMQLYFGTPKTQDKALDAAAKIRAETSATIARIESQEHQAEQMAALTTG